MDYSYLILGLVQGLTEFLPVSSSGHLTLFGNWLFKSQAFSAEARLAVNVVLHFGTLLALFAFFWKQISKYGKETFHWLKAPSLKLNSWQKEIFFIIVLTIPTGIIGLLMKKLGVAEVPQSVVLVALLVTGLLCIFVDRFPSRDEQLNVRKSIFLGVVQGLAVLPGISRSGSTIFAGLFLGISREKMASFSFLMSIPAILAAFGLECLEFWQVGMGGVHLPSLLVGTFVAFISGYLSLFVLIELLKKKYFKVFGVYCLLLGGTFLFMGYF